MAKGAKKSRRVSPADIAAAADRAEVTSAGGATSEEPRKAGRPTKYTERLGKIIALHIADGLSLRSIADLPGMPAKSTVLLWVIEHEEFRTIYTRARELQLESEADEIVDIADDGRNDWKLSRSGEFVVDKEAVDRSKLRVAARQWRLERLNQGKYGNKVEQKHTTDAAFLDLWKMMAAPQPAKK